MNTVLVTGSTGFLGRMLASRLAGEGYKVHALYRSEDKIRDWEHENITFFKGTLGDRESIARAMKGCRQVYHVAAYTSVYSRDPEKYYRENVEGTVNVLESALNQGGTRVVFTSTAGVLGPSGENPNTEDKNYQGEHFTRYDHSKAQAEAKVQDYITKGLDAVIVSPSRIYGPGCLSKSNVITSTILSYIKGKWKFIPGDGRYVGNYVYVDDVVNCHLLAMEKGSTGERYLAAGDNINLNEFFEILAGVSGISHKLYRIPGMMIMPFARLMMFFGRLTGIPPLITPSFVRRYNNNWALSTEKANRELGYQPVSFEEGLKKTIEWIKS